MKIRHRSFCLFFLTLATALAISACAAPEGNQRPAGTATLVPAPVSSPTPMTTVNFNNTPLPPTRTTEPSPTPWRPLSGSGGGVIAFVSERNGSPGIYLMNADGSDTRVLTNSYDLHPDWSPDGKYLAYSTRRSNIVAIYSYDLETHSEDQLTHTDRAPSDPDWSPDGTRFAMIYNPKHPGVNYELFLMNANGKGFQRLTNSVGYQYYDNPDWSPDGTRIAFAVDLDETYNIYLMDPNGTNIVQLTSGAGSNNKPAWSPDGGKIAFESNRDGNWEIYLMNADGSSLERLTNHPDDDKWPSWSADGTRIAFQSDRDGNWEIYIMKADGSDLQRLTENEVKDSEPAWKPEN